MHDDHDEIDPLSPIARYQQIADIYRRKIQTGQLKAGEALPSRVRLMELYGVARMTAHRALQVLVEEGLVVIVPGVGAYVRCQK